MTGHADLIDATPTATGFYSTAERGLFPLFRAAFRLLFLLSLTLFYSTGVALLSLSGRAHAPRVARIARRWAAGLIAGLGVRLEVAGVPPAAGALLVANHRSYIDIALLLSQVPCVMLAKAEVGRWPLLGWAARQGGTVFVSREDRTSRKAARAALLDRVQDGVSVAVFPEGTTDAGPGLRPFRPGVFHLAAESAVPVVPVALEYADPGDAWVGDDTFLRHFLARFGRKRLAARVVFGPVLEGSDGDLLRGEAERWIADNLRRPAVNP